MSRELPVPKNVRDLVEELLGRNVNVNQADPIRQADIANTMISVYRDDSRRIGALVGMDFKLTVYTAAALGLVPAGGAEACIEDRDIPPMLAENAVEVCNILTSLLNQAGQPHLKLDETYLPGQAPPPDVTPQVVAIGRRLDLTVEIGGYGSGKLSIVLTG
jgi:hypothetical protein